MIGTARVDRSGRLQHSGILHALRWRPGEDLDVDLTEASADDVTALLITPAPDQHRPVATDRRHMPPTHRPTSSCRIDARGAITLPAAARARCHITVESTVVLVADPAANRLIVLPTATAAGLLMSVSTLLAPAADPHRRPSRDNHEGHQDER